jgi:hypothetical protein
MRKGRNTENLRFVMQAEEDSGTGAGAADRGPGAGV